MRPCKTAVALFFFPLMFGALVGVAIVNSWLTALEDARRERRRREEERVTRDTELRFLIWDTAQKGPVIETVWTETKPDANAARN